jgi:hypothetical protein
MRRFDITDLGDPRIGFLALQRKDGGGHPHRAIISSRPSLQGLSHAGVARRRRRRMISAVKPDEPASNLQQRDNALGPHACCHPLDTFAPRRVLVV